MVCSVSVAEGEAVAMTVVWASGLERLFLSTLVRFEPRYGMWTFLSGRAAAIARCRMHSLRVMSEELISAASFRRSASWCIESSFLSEPARSTRVRRPFPM